MRRPTRAESTAETVRLVGQTAFGTRLPGVCLLPRRLTVPSPQATVHEPPRSDAGCWSPRSMHEPIVASLGHPAYDLFAAGDRPANFYTWGSMGLASSIGLGLALARPDLRVFVLDGDGSLLMNLGSLATIGWTRPANLVLIVWDNEVYGTTGGQDTATAHGADLEAAARAMGAAATATVTTGEALRRRDRAVARRSRGRG